MPASELLLEGRELFGAMGDKLGVANALEELGAVSALQADWALAAMSLSAAHALRQAMGAPLPPVDRGGYESVVEACRTRLGEGAFAEAWARGESRPWQEAVAEALALPRD
ncbi:MAG TPA: hypothetical protein PKO09_12845 [Anaerolineae bacterium]|nr:hypothetical protein [Anaerolineae bacterium]